MQLYLAKKNQTFDMLQPLHIWLGFLTKCELKQKLGEPATLNIELVRTANVLLELLRDTDDLALRLIDSESNLDIAFIRQEDSQVDTESGSSFQFVSYIKSLKYKLPHYSTNQALTGSNANLITALTTDFVWQNAGIDATLAYNSGSKNNLEILNELCKKAGWSYREDGFEGVYVSNPITQNTEWRILPKVLFGDFKSKPVTLFLNNWHSYDLTNPIIIDEPKRKNKVRSYKYNKIIGTLSGSGSSGSSLFLGGGIQTNSLYPIQSINNGQNVGEGYINDQTQTVEDYDTISIPIWSGATTQDLYNLAVVELEKRKKQYLYEFSVMSRTFVKAGEKVKIDFVSETLPLSFEATVRESMFDFATGFGKLQISEEPTIQTLGKTSWQVQQGLDIIKEQQTSPQ